MLEFKGKKYDFRDNGKYTRVLDHGHECLVCNAPDDISDEEAIMKIDGGGIRQNWGYMSIPKDKLPEYEVE